MTSVSEQLYESLVGRRRYIVLGMAVITILLFFIDIALGPMRYSLAEVIQTVFNPGPSDDLMTSVIWNDRLPKAVTALLAGIALAMAGAEMQTILDNPLAEPYTLGVSSAAAFGAALVLAFGIGTTTFGDYATPVMAFIIAMLVCFLIYTVAKIKSSDRTTIILIGVALLFLFQALVQLAQSISSQDSATSIMLWTFGSLGRAGWTDLGILLVVILLVAILFAKNLWRLTALKLGDSKASSLGVDVGKLRRNTLIGVSVLTAVTVSFTGTIGFVGLVGPHIARMLVGDDQRYFLPVSALAGAMMLLAAAVVCKLSDFTMDLPIGVVTSLVGVPFFIYMILKRRKVFA